MGDLNNTAGSGAVICRGPQESEPLCCAQDRPHRLWLRVGKGGIRSPLRVPHAVTAARNPVFWVPLSAIRLRRPAAASLSPWPEKSAPGHPAKRPWGWSAPPRPRLGTAIIPGTGGPRPSALPCLSPGTDRTTRPAFQGRAKSPGVPPPPPRARIPATHVQLRRPGRRASGSARLSALPGRGLTAGTLGARPPRACGRRGGAPACGLGALRPAGTQRRRREGGARRAGGGGGRKGRGPAGGRR